MAVLPLQIISTNSFPLVPHQPMGFRANGHRIPTSHVSELLGDSFSASSISIGAQSTNRLLWVIGPSIRDLRIELPLTTVSNFGQIDFFYRSCSFDSSTYGRTNFICFCKTLLSLEGIIICSKQLSLSPLFVLIALVCIHKANRSLQIHYPMARE